MSYKPQEGETYTRLGGPEITQTFIFVNGQWVKQRFEIVDASPRTTTSYLRRLWKAIKGQP